MALKGATTRLLSPPSSAALSLMEYRVALADATAPRRMRTCTNRNVRVFLRRSHKDRDPLGQLPRGAHRNKSRADDLAEPRESAVTAFHRWED